MEFVSWDSLNDYFMTGTPATVPVKSGSNAFFFYSGSGGDFGLRLPAGGATGIAPSPFEELTTSLRQVQGEPVLELAIRSRNLFHTFYLFSLGILEQLASVHSSAREAVESSLVKWNRLLEQKKVLTDAEQLGLSGELVLLHLLLQDKGVGTLDCWIGPLKEPHDFRLERTEIEVKSTMRKARIHRISSLEQLEASAGMSLWILSLQFEPAGAGAAGRTLPERVAGIRGLLEHDPERSGLFESRLVQAGYQDADAVFYPNRLKLRTVPCLIPVQDGFPCLTRSILSDSLPGVATARILHVEYDLSLDGMGFLESTSEFQAALGTTRRMGVADESD